MPIDLKPYYDAANAADVEAQRILNEIDAAFNLGTEEGKQKALGLRESLETAQANAKAANELYITLKNASAGNNVAQNFVPISETPSTPVEEKPKGVMKLAEFQNLIPRERLAFVKAGGKLED